MSGRDWSVAHAKIKAEGKCRVAHCSRPAGDAAHVIPRSLGGGQEADSTVPLCRPHHTAYDAHELDLLPYLTLDEQAEAVRIVGIERARKRLAPTAHQAAEKLAAEIEHQILPHTVVAHERRLLEAVARFRGEES